MKPQEWREQLGECVRDLFRSPEMEHFYSVKLTEKRAQIYLLQLESLCPQTARFLAPGGCELSGVRRQTAHYVP